MRQSFPLFTSSVGGGSVCRSQPPILRRERRQSFPSYPHSSLNTIAFTIPIASILLHFHDSAYHLSSPPHHRLSHTSCLHSHSLHHITFFIPSPRTFFPLLSVSHPPPSHPLVPSTYSPLIIIFLTVSRKLLSLKVKTPVPLYPSSPCTCSCPCRTLVTPPQDPEVPPPC